MTQNEILKFSIDQVQTLLEERYTFDHASLNLFKGKFHSGKKIQLSN